MNINGLRSLFTNSNSDMAPDLGNAHGSDAGSGHGLGDVDGLWGSPVGMGDVGDGIQFSQKSGGNYEKVPAGPHTTVNPGPGGSVDVNCPDGTHPEVRTGEKSTTVVCAPDQKPQKPKPERKQSPDETAPILD